MSTVSKKPPVNFAADTSLNHPYGEDSTSDFTPTERKETSLFVWVSFNFLLPLGILLLGVGAFFMFGKQTAPVKPPENQSLAGRISRLPEVQTLPVRSLASVGGRLNLEVDGLVVPYREVQLAAEVAGRITLKDPMCEVGAYVREGQLLFRIDPTDYQNEIDRLTKQKEQEYQAVRELDQEMVNTQRLIELAKQDVELQNRELKRLTSLGAGIASQGELDKSKKALIQSENTRVNWENQLDLMRQRRTRLEAAEQFVETQLQSARTNLERAEIRSPIAGVIVREDAELNSFVQRGQVMVTLEDTTKAEVVVNLRTDQLFWVLDQDRNSADPVDLSTPNNALNYSLPSTDATIQYSVTGRDDEVYNWSGKLERYDGIGFDSTSRTVPVRILVENPRRYEIRSDSTDRSLASTGPSALVRGMFVRVVLHVQPKRSLLVLPAVTLKPGNLVWKFSPDPDALNDVPNDAESPVPTIPDEVVAEEKTEFDPSKWTVGRLEVLSRVRPIESAQLVPGETGDGPLALDGTGKASYWICEVAGGELVAGDQLIVSPLPAFDSQAVFFVREAIPSGDPIQNLKAQ